MKAEIIIEKWRKEYNGFKPHSASIFKLLHQRLTCKVMLVLNRTLNQLSAQVRSIPM